MESKRLDSAAQAAGISLSYINAHGKPQSIGADTKRRLLDAMHKTDAANAKTKLENGFDLTDYDIRTLNYAKDYSRKLLAIDVNLDTTEMLDVTWDLFAKHFKPAEVNIKQSLVDQYWKVKE